MSVPAEFDNSQSDGVFGVEFEFRRVWLGNQDVWSFMMGASKDRPTRPASETTANSLLARWRQAAANSAQRATAASNSSRLGRSCIIQNYFLTAF
jgi:hypothetical protein